jgi:hypothetical protein
MHALQDAMRLKDSEIERLKKEYNDTVTAMQANKRNSLSLCSPTEMKPSLDVINPSQEGMNLNIEL